MRYLRIKDDNSYEVDLKLSDYELAKKTVDINNYKVVDTFFVDNTILFENDDWYLVIHQMNTFTCNAWICISKESNLGEDITRLYPEWRLPVGFIKSMEDDILELLSTDIIRNIISHRYDEGVQDGKETIRTDMRDLLNISK